MRISDWSSDVCSSDLSSHQEPTASRADDARRVPGARSARFFRERSRLHGGLRPESLPDRAVPQTAREIGRASCRERVCQYVYISLVSVTLKQKHITYTLRHNTNHTLPSHTQQH